MTTKSDYSYKPKPSRWYQKPKPKKVLHKHSRKQVHNGFQFGKINIHYGGGWLNPGMNTANYGACLASTKTHKRNNKH